MEKIIFRDKVIYRPEEGYLLKFVGTNVTYCEIVVSYDCDEKIEEVEDVNNIQ